MNLYQSKEPVNLTIPMYAGFIVSLVVAVAIISNLFGYGSLYDNRVIVLVLFLVACWGCLFVYTFIKNRHRNKYGIISWSMFTIVLLLLGIRMSTIIWGSNYLHLDIYDGLVHNRFWYDPLFHSETAMAIGTFGFSARHINGITPFGYHVASHVILMLINKATGINQLFVYCYVYPAIVFPLFVASFFMAAAFVRSIVCGDKGSKITVLDAIIVFALFADFLPEGWFESLAIWTTRSGIVSETYAFANMFMLLFIVFAAMSYKRGWLDNKIYKILFCLVICPFAIFSLTLLKISVGFITCGAVMYFFFRRAVCLASETLQLRPYIKSLFNWSAIVMAAVGWLLAFLVMESGSVWGDFVFEWKLFSFTGTYATPALTPMHYLVYCGFAFMVLYFRYRKAVTFKEMIGEKYIFEHILVIAVLVGMLPGMLINIVGGSAAYFAGVQLRLAMLMLLAYDYPNKIAAWVKENTEKIGKVIAGIVATLMCLSLFLNNNYERYFSFIFDKSRRADVPHMSFPPSGHLGNPLIVLFDKADKEVRNARGDYWMFIDETSVLWDLKDPLWTLRQLMAYTGVVLANAIYYEDDHPYYRNGEDANDAWFYPLETNPRDSFPRVYKMELHEIIEDARAHNIKKIIHFVEDTMKVIDVNESN